MLPTCMAIVAHGSCYLRSVHYEGNGGGSFIELGDGGGPNNPRSRFYLEASKEHDDGSLMHVRCCFNNKYWVPQQREQDGWVIGTCDGPEEDLSKPSCTLFKLLIPEHEEHSIRFLHCKLGKLCSVLPSSDTPRRLYMRVKDGEADVVDAFTFLDLSQQKQLPKYLAFKGDNGKYLRVMLLAEGVSHCFGIGMYFPAPPPKEYLQFSAEDIRDPEVVHTSFTNDDGTVRIKSNQVDKFWRLHDSWILPDESNDNNTCNDRDTLFKVKVITSDTDEAGAKFITLRNLGNNKICKRLPNTVDKFPPKQDCLSVSDDDSITQYARLQLEEPVVSRLIYDIHFHPGEARFHTINEVIDVDAKEHDNNTSQQETGKVAFIDTHTTTKTWNSSISVKVGVKTTFKTGIPIIVDGKIEVSAEAAYSHSWGEAITETRTKTSEFSFPVPPHSRVTVKAIEYRGVCDVPYSYKQKDVLFSGEEVIHEFHDGIFSAVTSVIKYESTEEKLGSICHVEEPPAEK